MVTRPALVSSFLSALAGIVGTVAIASSSGVAKSDPAIHLTVTAQTDSRPISPGFVGLSTEIWAVEGYAGDRASTLNPVLVQLMRNLAPGNSMVLRIGGSSADATWWHMRNLRRPRGITITINRRWISVTRSLADATGSHLILDVNLEAPNIRLPVTEARAMIGGIGKRRIDALELGNEPEMWSTWAWYQASNGQPVMARPPTYNLDGYIRDSSRFARFFPRMRLAGPTDWAPLWVGRLHRFVAAEPRLGLVTLHRYPLARCFPPHNAPQFPTIAHLLVGGGETKLLTWGLTNAARVAHAYHLPLRLDELNSVSCSGAHGVSDTFASALWALDALFAVAKAGVDGVNIHTFPGGAYALFDFTHQHGTWKGYVHPEYYGLMMFLRAAPPGSRLLRTSLSGQGTLRAWATRAPDGSIRVVLINQGTSRTRTIAIRIPQAARIGTLERLAAPRLTAGRHVTLAGQSFGAPTTTGTLRGSPHSELLTRPLGGAFVVKLPPASAAMLTVTGG